MRHRSFALAEVILVLVLGVSAFGLGAAASELAEPAATAQPAAARRVVRPVASATRARVDASAPVRLCKMTGSRACGVLESDPIQLDRRGQEAVPHVGTLAVWNASYEPHDTRVALIHVATAARWRPLAFIYMEQDWAELVATGSGSLAHSARPRELAEATGG
jgi:hypothetical protein